jgi:hypothetical protein
MGEDVSDSRTPLNKKPGHAGPSNAADEGTQNVRNVPKMPDIIATTFGPKTMMPATASAKGYDGGQYVSRLGTPAQEKEIREAPEAVARKRRSWYRRMFGKRGV